MILWELFITFIKIGLFAFGGGYGMIPLIREEVLNHGWLTEDMLYNFIGIAESTPGPIAINMATFIGTSQAGFIGGVVATIGVVLPIFIIMLLIVKLLKNFKQNKVINALFNGIKPIVIGLILATGIYLLYQNLFIMNENEKSFNLLSLIIFGILIIIYFVYQKVFKKKIPSILFIIISGILGIILNS